MATSFPLFRLLPAELRIQIWEEALRPSPKISTISLSYTRWDRLGTQVFDEPIFEASQGNLWYFAFTPCKSLPAAHFAAREAFSIGQRFYHVTRQRGHEIVDKSVIKKSTTVDGEIVVEDYSGSMPVTVRKERDIVYSIHDLVQVTVNPRVTIEADLPLSHHAISDLSPLRLHGVKYLVMDAMEFYNRMYAMDSNSLVFVGLEVLFLVMGCYAGMRQAGLHIPDDGAVDMWDFLKPCERLDLEAGTAKWNIKEVVFVRSIEEALEKVERRSS